MGHRHIYKLVRETKTKALNISTSLILVAMSLGGALPAFITNTAHAAGCSAADSSAVINEVSSNPSAGNTEWVELYNKDAASCVDISQWKIKSGGNTFANIANNTSLAAHGYLVVEATTGTNLSDSGSTAELFTKNGSTPVDSVAYPALGSGESYGRSPDGSSNLVTFSAANVTKGTTNYVTPTNTAPTLTTSGGNAAFTQGGGSVAVDGGLAVSDADSSTLASATVTITGNFQSGEDVLAFTNDGSTMGNIAGSYNSATGVLTLTSAGTTATVAQWQAALRSVAYNDTATTPDASTRTVSFTANDGTDKSNSATRTVTVTATPVAYNYPSTNAANKAAGHGYVEEISATTSSVTLAFHNPDNYVMCFEYRSDGDTSQKLSDNGGNNYNTAVHDGLYPHYCLTDETQTHIIPASSYVEVRSTFGDERDTDFDWTRFNVAPQPVDTQAPTAQFTSPASGKAINTHSSLTVKGNYQEQGTSGISRIRLYVSKGNGYSYAQGQQFGGVSATLVKNGTSGTFSYTFTAAQLQARGATTGDNLTITAVPIDNAGNGQTTRDNLVLIVDNDQPTGTITSPGAYIRSSQNFIVKGTYTEVGPAGLNYIHVYVSHGNHYVYQQYFNNGYATLDRTNHTWSYEIPASQMNTYGLTTGDQINVLAVPIDNAGNGGANRNVQKYFTVDNAAPTATYTQPTGQYVNNSNGLTVSGTYTENGPSGINVIELYVSKGNGYNYGNHSGYFTAHLTSTGGNTGTFTYNLPSSAFTSLGIASGDQFTITAVPIDNAGNGQTTRDNLVLTNDNTAPAAPTITSPTPRQWFNSTPILDSWTAVTQDVNGNPENVDHYQIAYVYDDGHTFGGSTCSGAQINSQPVSGCRDTTATYRNHVPADNEQGGVTIYVRAIDKAGNVGAWSQPVHYYYDSSDPQTTITVSVANGKLTVSGDATDNLALNRIYVQLVNRDNNQRYGGTTINLITSPFSTSAHWSKTYDMKALGYPDGNYAANASVTDMAGNSSDPGWTQNYLVDTTAPAIPSNLSLKDANGNPIADGHATNSYNVTAGWTDNDQSVDHYIYKYWNNIQTSSYDGEANAWTTTTTSTSLPGVFNEGEGTHYFCIEAVDAAGNVSACSTPFSVIYDHTAPVVAITAPGNGSVLKGTVIIAGTTSTDTDHYYLVVKDANDHVVAGPGVVQGATVADYSWDTTQVADGTYTIDLEARDQAGNKDNGSVQTIQVVVDNTDPGVISNLTHSVNGSAVTWNWDAATDATSGVAGYLFDLTDSQGNHVVNFPTTTPDATLTKLVSSLPDDTYTFSVWTVDSAGNKGAAVTDQVIVDTTPPAVVINGYGKTGNVIQPNVTVDGSSTPTGYTYSWTTRTGVTVSNTGALNPTFTVNTDGSYTFQLTVTDASGNQTTVPFSFSYTTPNQQQGGQNNGGFGSVSTTSGNNGGTNGTPVTLNNSGTGTTTPQVLGASTKDGNVQGDSTVNVENSSKQQNKDTGNSQFLGLGWWWLPILLVILAAWWILFGPRRKASDN